jgi:hypothetical protein
MGAKGNSHRRRTHPQHCSRRYTPHSVCLSCALLTCLRMIHRQTRARCGAGVTTHATSSLSWTEPSMFTLGNRVSAASTSPSSPVHVRRQPTPVQLPLPQLDADETVAHLDCGAFHNVIATSKSPPLNEPPLPRRCLMPNTDKGRVWAWGAGDCGQLGARPDASGVALVTFPHPELGAIDKLVCGAYHSFLLSGTSHRLSSGFLSLSLSVILRLTTSCSSGSRRRGALRVGPGHRRTAGQRTKAQRTGAHPSDHHCAPRDRCGSRVGAFRISHRATPSLSPHLAQQTQGSNNQPRLAGHELSSL